MAYLLIPLDDALVFPGVSATLSIDVGEEDRVFLLPEHDGEYGRVGVVAEVVERGRSRRGSPAATVVGLHRGLDGGAIAGEDGGVSLRLHVQQAHNCNPTDHNPT